MSRARKVLGVIGAVVGTTVVFGSSVAAAVVLHLDVPATRRLVATQVTKVLHDTFQGQVTIEHVGHLGLGGLGGVKARIVDPEGQRVLFVDGVAVEVRSLAAARSAVLGKGPITIDVDHVGIDYVDVALDTDAKGELRIANVFAPKKPSPPSDPNAPKGRGVVVRVPKVVLGHAWVHGAPPGAPTLDVELDRLRAHANVNALPTDGDVAATLDEVHVASRNLPNAANPRGVVNGRFSMPFDHTDRMATNARFDGAIGELPTIATAEMEGKRLGARVDVQGATGERLRAMFGDVPVKDTVTAHVEAEGVLPLIDAKIHATLGEATADGEAAIALGTTTDLRASLRVRKVDLRSLDAGAPASDLGVDARGTLAIGPGGKLMAKASAETMPGRIGADAVPGAAIAATYDGARADAVVNVRDDDLPTTIEASYEDDVANVHITSAVKDLRTIPRTNRAIAGNATLDARARVDLRARNVDGRVLVRGRALGYDVHRARDLTFLATADGPLERPRVDVGVHVTGVRAAGQDVDAVDVRGVITPPSKHAPLLVEQAHVDLVRSDRSVGVTATTIRIDGDTVNVEGGVIQGLGAPIYASFDRDARSMRATVAAPKIDLAVVGVLAHAKDLRRGTVALSGDVTVVGDDARGAIHVAVEDLTAGEVHGAGAKIDARLAGRSVDLDVDAALAEAGHVSVKTSGVRIAGSAIDARSWKRAQGKVSVDADVDLGKLGTLLPEGTLPVGELRGEAIVRAVASRATPDAGPQLDLSAYTRGLVVAGAAPLEPAHGKTKVEPVPPWRIDDTDLHVDAAIDSLSGNAELAVLAHDVRGRLVSVDVKTQMPFHQMLAAPEKARAIALAAPVNARVQVPARALDRMPKILGLAGFEGVVDADLSVTGTPLDPRVKLVAHGRDVRSPSLPVRLATDTDLDVTYDGRAMKLAAKVKTDKEPLVDLSSELALRLRDVVEGKPLDWNASSRVRLTRFPLQTVAFLQDRRVRGRVSGEVALEGLHRDATLRGALDFDKLKIGAATYEKAKVTVSAEGGKLAARARFDQSDGFADAKVDASLAWGAELVPTLKDDRPLVVQLDAKGFRAAAAAPFVQGPLNQLDGRIDATARIELGRDTKMQGRVTLREGVADVVALGTELRDVRATVNLAPDGTIRVDDVFARGLEGEVRADAEVKMRGLSVASAKANLRIPNDKPFNLALQGQPLGDVFGEAHLVASGNEAGLSKVAVDVPRFSVKLPQVMKSGLQELEARTNVRVGVLRDGRFARLPLDHDDGKPKKKEGEETTPKNTLGIDVRLGEITVIRGNQARVVLGGNLHVDQGETAKVSGQIALKGGTLDLQGKKFKIERGTVTFQPTDTSNPIVVVTASWTAGDGTKVFADFVGPVKTGKVNLRSEPARPKNEILALVLFGTADGMNAAPPPPGRAPDGTTKAATAVGGGFAAEGLSEALDDLAGIQAQARIDTTESNNPRPELEVQLAQDISVAFAHVLGNPPITDPDRNLARVDWRFTRNWSLETTVGDRGKAEVDAVWQYRY